MLMAKIKEERAQTEAEKRALEIKVTRPQTMKCCCTFLICLQAKEAEALAAKMQADALKRRAECLYNFECIDVSISCDRLLSHMSIISAEALVVALEKAKLAEAEAKEELKRQSAAVSCFSYYLLLFNFLSIQSTPVHPPR